MLDREKDDSPRHKCFGCGDQNPEGLHIHFEIEGKQAIGRFTPRANHVGFPGVAHGGVVAAALDEAMGWAMYAAGAWAVTAHMEVRYRRPLKLADEVIVTAEVTRDRGKRLEAEARLETQAGDIIAECTGLFLRMPESESSRVQASFLGDPTA
ncbi:MAG: PaaI family thioesterase [Chloroflexota bacterium]